MPNNRRYEPLCLKSDVFYACRCLRTLKGHTKAVQGLAIAPSGEVAVSCSADCTVKVWKVPHAPFQHGPVEQEAKPIADLVGPKAFLGADYQPTGDHFATCGSVVHIWDVEHADPIQTFTWGADNMNSIRFNPVRPANCCTHTCITRSKF